MSVPNTNPNMMAASADHNHNNNSTTTAASFLGNIFSPLYAKSPQLLPLGSNNVGTSETISNTSFSSQQATVSSTTSNPNLNQNGHNFNAINNNNNNNNNTSSSLTATTMALFKRNNNNNNTNLMEAQTPPHVTQVPRFDHVQASSYNHNNNSVSNSTSIPTAATSATAANATLLQPTTGNHPSIQSVNVNTNNNNSTSSGSVSMAQCSPHMLGYRKCLEVNPDAKINCTWALDNYMKCQETYES